MWREGHVKAVNALANRQVLLVENDFAVRESLRNALETEGLAVCAIPCNTEVIHRFAAGCFDVVLLDFSENGLHERLLLKSFREINPKVQIIIITVVRELAEAARATGAWQAFEKPLRLPDLLKSIASALSPENVISNIPPLSSVQTVST